MIRNESESVRLMALSDIYKIYLPSEMSKEIYSKLYLAMIRSLEKKRSKLAVRQQNENGRKIQNHTGMDRNSYQGIIGGSDSFTIIGISGIGKSSAISRAITIATENRIIETQNPFCKIIPCILVQCPLDCSVKGILLEVLRKVDEAVGSNFYENAIRARATTDMLIGSVSQVALNHIALLVVDEIQNVVNHRNGMQLVGMLTQLINNSGISVCMVGTPESEVFFEKVNYLARRALGLKYENCNYNDYFREFCEVLFSYQYVKRETEISEGLIQWLYEHSSGVISTVVSLIHDAQEIAILNGSERLDLYSLNEAYEKRMGMLRIHIKPSVTIKRQMPKRKKNALELVKEKSIESEDIGHEIHKDNKDKNNDKRKEEAILGHSTDKNSNTDLSFLELAEKAKENQQDIVELLKGKISITEIMLGKGGIKCRFYISPLFTPANLYTVHWQDVMYTMGIFFSKMPR